MHHKGKDLFFFNDTATTEIYTLSLHDALPICKVRYQGEQLRWRQSPAATGRRLPMKSLRTMWSSTDFGASELTRYARSEEHTAELQSRSDLVCRLLLLMTKLALLYHAPGPRAA